MGGVITETDGRKRRSEKSRERIVDALIRLVLAGDMHPGAADVAEEAGVSLRTVFRHFEELESLHIEMIEKLAAENMPALLEPYEASNWRGRLEEMLERRFDLFDKVMLARIYGALRRFQSPAIMADFEQSVVLERHSLSAILPEDMQADQHLMSLLDTVASFEAWRRMRQDEGLSSEDARQVVAYAFKRLLDE